MKVFIYSPLLSLSLIYYRWLFPWCERKDLSVPFTHVNNLEDSFLVAPLIPGYFPHPLTRLETSWPSFGPSTTTLLSASVPLHVFSLFLVGLGSLSLACEHSDQVLQYHFFRKAFCLNSQMRSSLYLNTFVGFTLYYLLPKRKWMDIVDFKCFP